jgi:unsaturated rhamnogalacturonyl hydrolase
MNLCLPAILCAASLLPTFLVAQTPSRTPLAQNQGGGQQQYFGNWPPGESPEELGKALAEKFAAMPLQGAHTTGYPEVCAWYGALTFARVTHDDALRDKLIARFGPLLPGGAETARIPVRHHVDDSIFGVVPLEIAIQTHDLPNSDTKYLKLGLGFADRQWEVQPGYDYAASDVSTSDLKGLSPETRYWVDDMYMLTMLQLEAYRATGDRKYLDRDAREMVSYLDKLQQPNGLFFHAPDVPYFWGRGDGWFAAGMAEMLRTLPADHPDRPRILAGYKRMMAALLKYQGPDGMWHELIDHPEAWPESSSSAMFTFAMITGVKHGWLDAATYGPAARKGWIAVAGYVDQNHDVTQVCEGTNKKDDLQYYLDRHRRTGDLHGQAPVMWAATALLRDEK